MRTRNHHLEFTANDLEGDELTDRDEKPRTQYSRGRSARSHRRRSSRSVGANVPLGIAARRNRRWSW